MAPEPNWWPPPCILSAKLWKTSNKLAVDVARIRPTKGYFGFAGGQETVRRDVAG